MGLVTTISSIPESNNVNAKIRFKEWMKRKKARKSGREEKKWRNFALITMSLWLFIHFSDFPFSCFPPWPLPLCISRRLIHKSGPWWKKLKNSLSSPSSCYPTFEIPFNNSPWLSDKSNVWTRQLISNPKIFQSSRQQRLELSECVRIRDIHLCTRFSSFWILIVSPS